MSIRLSVSRKRQDLTCSATHEFGPGTYAVFTTLPNKRLIFSAALDTCLSNYIRNLSTHTPNSQLVVGDGEISHPKKSLAFSHPFAFYFGEES